MKPDSKHANIDILGVGEDLEMYILGFLPYAPTAVKCALGVGVGLEIYF
jgi:hypothetical protein